jgi:hypothetical protein
MLVNIASLLFQASYNPFLVVIREAMGAVVPEVERLRRSIEDIEYAATPAEVRGILDSDERREDQLGLIQPATAEAAPPPLSNIYVSADLSADEVRTLRSQSETNLPFNIVSLRETLLGHELFILCGGVVPLIFFRQKEPSRLIQ